MILTGGSQSAVGRAHHEKNRLVLRPLGKHAFGYPIKPKNVEQEFALGRDIGFLPGSIDEKMSVWLKPFKDNLEHLIEPEGRDLGAIDHLFDDGIIEVGVLSYIRGRSIPNQFILIDECQNLERHAIKSVLTRVGKNSRACLTGDLSQIDHPLLDTVTNGLTHVIESLKGEPTVGHITLTKGARSNLATLIAERL